MSRPLIALAVFAALLPSVGCNLQKPNWLAPGPTGYQQAQARVYDPYPDPMLGPDSNDMRPRDFGTPRTQTDPERRPPRF